MKKLLIYSFLSLSFFLAITSFNFSHKYTDTPKEVEKAFEKALEFAKKEKDKPHFTYYFEEKDKNFERNNLEMRIRGSICCLCSKSAKKQALFLKFLKK